MESENSGYFQRSNLENMCGQNPHLFQPNPRILNINTQPFIPSPLRSEFQFPYSNMSYCSEPFKNFQPALDRPNPFIDSRFKWTQNTKPDFTFSSNSHEHNLLHVNYEGKSPTGTFGFKRKTKSPPPVPLKQHITEEKMAEHMSQLHISSATQVLPKETEPVRERRLYMCEEMQRLQAESIIPIQILEKVQRPCTALIPWKPPILLTTSKEGNNNNKEQEELDNSTKMPTDDGIMDTSLCE